MWKEPEGSNGPIVSYHLEYKKVGDHVRSRYINIIILTVYNHNNKTVYLFIIKIAQSTCCLHNQTTVSAI